MRYRYPQPGNEDEFEDFCVRFYRQLLKRGGLVRYAKRGEHQDGIDIIDQHGVQPLFAIQCKHHEPTKTIPPKEIKDEVALAESSCHSIGSYIIATTAKKSKNAQDTVLELNQRKQTKTQTLNRGRGDLGGSAAGADFWQLTSGSVSPFHAIAWHHVFTVRGPTNLC